MYDDTLCLFGGIAGLLLFASSVGWLLKLRCGRQPNAVIDNLNARINAWWVMVAVIGGAFWLGHGAVVVLFAAVSFFALREFITLTPTRRSDYPALFAAFYFALPMQYFLTQHSLVHAVYHLHPGVMLLLMPILSCLGGDSTRFLERTAKVRWGLMIAVFCISFVPALLTLDIPGYEGRNLLLVAYLIVVVQSSDVLQYVCGKLCGKHIIAPHLSPSKTGEGFLGGVGLAVLLGSALYWITPFNPWQAAVVSLAITLAGLFRRAGHVGHKA